MRKSARAIIITKDNKLLLMKRTKPDGVYYVTIGGGIEDGETSEQALLRELKEESGSIVDKPVFAFHFDDIERQNSVDFYVCKEINRIKPTGTEWTKWNTPDNQYELVEVSIDEVKKLPLKPNKMKEKIIDTFQNSIKKI
ncbi:MAG: NUDIX domain-containing protein [Alphaproteobacteria bacterium]